MTWFRGGLPPDAARSLDCIAGGVVRAHLVGYLTAALLVMPTSGQPVGGPAKRLEFEVASIKPAAVADFRSAQQAGAAIRVGPRIYGNRAEYVSMSMRQLIAEAYQVRLFQIADPPGGLSKGRFDIACKMPAGSGKDEARLMLQSLLADRFGLSVHREAKPRPVVALVVGKDGPRFQESAPEEEFDAADEKKPEGAASSGPVTRAKNGATVISGTSGRTSIRMTLDPATSSVRYETRRMTMAALADQVGGTNFAKDRPVVDMTGLRGEYDLTFDVPMSAIPGMVTAAAGESGPADAASTPGSGGVLRSIRGLGLDLQRREAQVERIVVDHVAPAPTAN
ncbi:TIGR03435 family protein [uncultured Paludibaculum sp.]|uniref:TIGR03435 family protein n=1 Tax=uncultured Paludibaculum sp. TaxID=1765020 RepID=UPI002AAB50DD|nr:TIGR03435 family protein [uncultured Paludibaculum sp.]